MFGVFMKIMVLVIVTFASCTFTAISADSAHTSNTLATSSAAAVGQSVSLPAVTVIDTQEPFMEWGGHFGEWAAGSEFGAAVHFPEGYEYRSVEQSTFGSVTYSTSNNARKFSLTIYPPIYFNRVIDMAKHHNMDLSYCSDLRSAACFPADKGVIETSRQPLPWYPALTMEVQTVYYRIGDTVYELTAQLYPMGDPKDPDIAQFLNSFKK